MLNGRGHWCRAGGTWCTPTHPNLQFNAGNKFLGSSVPLSPNLVLPVIKRAGSRRPPPCSLHRLLHTHQPKQCVWQRKQDLGLLGSLLLPLQLLCDPLCIFFVQLLKNCGMVAATGAHLEVPGAPPTHPALPPNTVDKFLGGSVHLATQLGASSCQLSLFLSLHRKGVSSWWPRLRKLH